MKILLVEDDYQSRSILSEFLKQRGHQIIECNNGEDALNKLSKEKVHLVLSDIHMPEMDGNELLRKIKGKPELEKIIVVLFTGYGELKSAIDALRNGAYDYLLKPINIMEVANLTERISEYLALKEENIKLTKNFKNELKEATKDVKKELEDIKKAYAREIGTVGTGFFFSKKIQDVLKTAKKLHRNSEIPVIIEGETGTGKEIIARLIHYGTETITKPFVGLNCAAISPNLFESELFGYEAGAFTGGKSKGQKGKLEMAAGGTLFLDEITEMPLEHQAKLLRVIQEREYYSVGGLKKHTTDVRFICATNKDIARQVEYGMFREDLYYRLNVGYLKIPPLRERCEEILPLAKMFLKQLIDQKRTRFEKINEDAVRILEQQPWPGNIRQLKNTIERLALLWDDVEVTSEHLNTLLLNNHHHKKKNNVPNMISLEDFALPEKGFNLDNWISDVVKKALITNKWNKTKTSKFLGISRRVLYTYLKNIED